MKGWIFANADQNQWTQKIFKHTSKFQNPSHKNYTHLRMLQSCLTTKSDSLFTVIIFISDSSFKTKMPDSVRFVRRGIEYIKSKDYVLFSEDEVEWIIDITENGRLERGIKTNR